MTSILKRLASMLPLSTLLELKRIHYSRQIKSSNFGADEKEYDLLSTWLTEGDWVIDVGANIGQYTKKMSDLVGDNGRVIAFEPILETFYLLAANTNKFINKSNVSLFNSAISDSMVVLGMDIPQSATGLNNYYQAHLVELNTAHSVLCIPLDNFDFPKNIKLVKIDAEGHELHVLKGMKNLISRDHPVLIVEDHSKDVEEFLMNQFGYNKEKLENSPNIIFTYKAN